MDEALSTNGKLPPNYGLSPVLQIDKINITPLEIKVTNQRGQSALRRQRKRFIADRPSENINIL